MIYQDETVGTDDNEDEDKSEDKDAAEDKDKDAAEDKDKDEDSGTKDLNTSDIITVEDNGDDIETKKVGCWFYLEGP